MRSCLEKNNKGNQTDIFLFEKYKTYNFRSGLLASGNAQGY